MKYMSTQWGAALSGYDRCLFVVWAPAGKKTTLPFQGAASGVQLGGAQAPRVIHEKTVRTDGGHDIHEALVSTPHGLVSESPHAAVAPCSGPRPTSVLTASCGRDRFNARTCPATTTGFANSHCLGSGTFTSSATPPPGSGCRKCDSHH